MRVSLKTILGIVVVGGVLAAVPYARGRRTGHATSTGAHLNIALSDHASARRAFTALVVRPFGRQWLTDGADVWPEPPQYDLIATAMPHSKWEVLELSDANFVRGKRDGLFAILPMPGGVGPSGGHEPVLGVPAGYLETALVYAPQRGWKSARGWEPLLDIAHYPGARALRDDPEGTLEVALLSDGVSPSHLYPLDVERAFRALDRLRPSVALWWKNEAEVVRAASTGTIAMAVVPTSFLYTKDWPETHLSVADSATLGGMRWWVVPRNTPITEEIQQFLAFVSGADEPIGTGTYYGLLGPQQPATRAAMTAASNRLSANGHVLINEKWWAEHRQSIAARWQAWRAYPPSR